MRILSLTTLVVTHITCVVLFRHNSLHAEPISNIFKASNNSQPGTVPTSLTTPNISSIFVPETAIERPFVFPEPRSSASLLDNHVTTQQPKSSLQPITLEKSSSELTPVEVTSAQRPSIDEVEELEQELASFQPAENNPYRSSPGITLSIPSGFGADRGRVFVSGGAQRTRVSTTDGAVGFGIGLGNATRAVGVQLSYTVVSVKGITRPVGSGAINLKIHRQFQEGWSVAIGADGLINIGKIPESRPFSAVFSDYNEFENTYYAVVTRIIPLRQDINAPFSRLALTVGAGSGRFRTEEQILRDRSGFIVNPFASAALRVNRSTSLIVEWTAQDLGVGLSIVPFRNLPLVLTPAIRDLAGPDAEKPRFIFGVGLSL